MYVHNTRIAVQNIVVNLLLVATCHCVTTLWVVCGQLKSCHQRQKDDSHYANKVGKHWIDSSAESRVIPPMTSRDENIDNRTTRLVFQSVYMCNIEMYSSMSVFDSEYFENNLHVLVKSRSNSCCGYKVSLTASRSHFLPRQEPVNHTYMSHRLSVKSPKTHQRQHGI